MTPEELRRIKVIFDAAFERPEQERSAYVKQACAGDASLETQVNSFLELSGRDDTLLDSSLAELMRVPDRSEHPAPELDPGAILNGRYVIDAVLERSRNSTIYVAKDNRVFGRPVVVKVRRRGGETTGAELRALSALSHPGVAGLLEYGRLENGSMFVVLEYVAGDNLRTLLRPGPFEPERALRCARQLAAVVASAHDAGIWHLDLKPENVIVTDPGTPEERVSLLDFDVARVANVEHSSFGGSPGYMAPEQAEGKPVLQSDIYSLGVLTFEMLTGALPVSAGRTPAALSAVRPRLPRKLRQAIERALRIDPAARFASCREFQRDLDWPIRTDRVRNFVAAAVVLTLGLMAGTESLRQARPVAVRQIPIAAEGGVHGISLSPDGKTLFYAAGSYYFEYMDLYARDLDTRRTRPLTSDGKFKLAPLCSPDGKRIVFARDRGLDLMTIVEMPASGGAERELLTGYSWPSAWATDSSALIFSSRTKEQQWPHLRGLDLHTLQSWDITPPPEQGRGEFFSALSPRGDLLAFVRKESRESSDLYLLAVDGRLQPLGSPRRLTSMRTRIAYPHWSRDGTELIFAAGTLSSLKLYRVVADGRSEPREIPEAGSGIELVTMAGGNVALTQVNERRSIWRLDLASPTGPVIHSNRIDVSAAQPDGPELSPDGKSVAFISTASGEEQVWISSAQGEHCKQVTFEPSVDGIHPIWLPDSSGLVVGARSKAFGLRSFLFQPPTSAAREIRGLHGDPIRFSRDGRWLYFSSRESGDVELFKYSIDTGTVRPVTANAHASYGVESPDGKTLYFSKPEEDLGLWKMPVNGGAPVQVLPQLARRSLFDIGTSGIYYMRREPRAIAIRLSRFSDGSDSELFRMESVPSWGFALTPDQRSLIFSRYDTMDCKLLLLNKIEK